MDVKRAFEHLMKSGVNYSSKKYRSDDGLLHHGMHQVNKLEKNRAKAKAARKARRKNRRKK